MILKTMRDSIPDVIYLFRSHIITQSMQHFSSIIKGELNEGHNLDFSVIENAQGKFKN